MDPGVQVLDCAFKNRTYTISPYRTHDHFKDFFEEIYEIDKHRSIKLNFVLYWSFILETQEVKENKSFNAKNKIITIPSDVSKLMTNSKKTKVIEFEAKGLKNVK